MVIRRKKKKPVATSQPSSECTAPPSQVADASQASPAADTSPPSGLDAVDKTESSPPPVKTLATVLGEIIWLMTRSPSHRHAFISDLEWMVLQPVALGQFRIFNGKKHPVGVLFWAFVNETVENRLKNGITRLAPAEWKSGDRTWLIDAVAPFGNTQAMIDDLKKTVFPDRPFSFLQRNPDGRLQVRRSNPAEGVETESSPEIKNRS